MLPRIKGLRNEYHISQQELANAVLINQQSLYKYKNKDVDPSVYALTKIAQYFNISIDYIIDINDTAKTRECIVKVKLQCILFYYLTILFFFK